MSEIRQILLFPIFLMILIYRGFLNILWQSYKGKVGKAMIAIRKRFKKEHPVLDKNLTILLFCAWTAMVLYLMVPLVSDFVEQDVQTVEGSVRRINKSIMSEVVYLEDSSFLWDWGGNTKIEEEKEYIFQYTKHAKVIINVIPQ